MLQVSKDILVIGLGIFGFETAMQLKKEKMNVVAMDKNTKLVNNIKDFVDHVFIADASDEDVLKELSIDQYDAVIVGMDSNFESLILCVSHLKKLNAKKIIAKAANAVQTEILYKIGADEIIIPEKEVATRLAERISRPNLIDIFHLSDDTTVATVSVPKPFVGKSLLEIDLRNTYEINAVQIKRDGKSAIIKSPSIVFQEGDEIIVIGEEDKIKNTFDHM